jgi:hypothetical protein
MTGQLACMDEKRYSYEVSVSNPELNLCINRRIMVK